MARAGKDNFVNYASITVTESAANTLTFAQLQTGGQLFERRALVIHRVDYNVTNAHVNLLNDGADSLNMGLSTSNQIDSIDISDPNIIDHTSYRLEEDGGTPVGAWGYQTPLVRDYSNLPGMGILTPAHPLFMFVQGGSLASAMGALRCRIYFTVRELSAQEFIELVEAMRVIT